MRCAAALACALVPAVASAAPAAGPRGHVDPAAAPVTPIIGGSDAAAGKWPDVAAVMFPAPSGEVPGCTGTLVAPTVVLTAGHCDQIIDPPLPDHVLIGASSLARPREGELIAIARGIPFPDAEDSEDIAVLVL